MSTTLRSKALKSLLVAAALGLAVQAQAGLIITEVMSSSAHGAGTNNGDWFELTNNGNVVESLSGLTWDDNTGTGAGIDFASVSTSITSLAPGESVIINEETVGAEATFRTNWNIPVSVQVVNLGGTEFQGLGSGGDQVRIFNGASVVTSVTFGSASAGFSFEWDRSGVSLGNSVNGENGAYVATNNGQDVNPGAGVDVGSPGVSVPEPSMLGLAAGLIIPLMSRRRRSV